MPPIKIKLSLSSASLNPSSPSVNGTADQSTNTPRKGSKAPQHARSGLYDAPTATPEAGPSRLKGAVPHTPAYATPSARVSVGQAQTPITSVETPSKSAKATSSAKGKSKAKSTKKTKKPTAIPDRLLSTAPSTPKSSVPLPLQDTPSPGTVSVKQEDGESYPQTPHAGSPSVEPEQMDTPMGDGMDGDAGTPTAGHKQSVRWMRIKRPLREHATKIVADLLKRDEYDLFGQPVDLEAYPDYLGIVGGEDKMMDLGTIQTKIDNEEYRSIDEFQADLEMIATAAKAFNPVGTIPHNAAIKIYNQGVKQIDRIRDIVLIPHPSRSGSVNNWRDGSVLSGRENTAGLEDGQPRPSKADIPPALYMPEEMLSYPPNSAAAKMVGWNLNGGKRVYLKKITRGREKFTGKWRHLDLDGARDVAEMEDPEFWFYDSKTRSGSKQRSIVDWKELRWGPWWEYEGTGGPNGQPPLPGATAPKRPMTREHTLTATDWGVYPDIDTEMAAVGKRIGCDEQAALYSHLNASRVKPPPPVPHNFVNLFEEPQNRQPIDYLRAFATGDVTGEAYTRSIDRFIKGAIAGRTKSDTKPDPECVDLQEYVEENYAYGILSKDFEQRPTIRKTIKELSNIRARSLKDQERSSNSAEAGYLSLAEQAYGRTALRHLTRNANSLDIIPLIRSPAEFTWIGIGGKGDIDIGLKWVTEQLAKADQSIQSERQKRKRSSSPSDGINKKPRIEEIPSSASSPLSAAPGSPVKDAAAGQVMSPTTFKSGMDMNDGENGLKRMRLELLALTKFYPLAALRKMDKASAEKLLPPNVRALMTRPR